MWFRLDIGRQGAVVISLRVRLVHVVVGREEVLFQVALGILPFIYVGIYFGGQNR